MDDLVSWLRAQLDDDERVALEASERSESHWSDGGPYGESVYGAEAGAPVAVGAWTGYLTDGIRRHIARHDPARVLAEVAAKRVLIERGDTLFCECDRYNPPMDPATNWTVPIPHHYDCTAYYIAKHLAVVYADRPGYRPEWAPDTDQTAT